MNAEQLYASHEYLVAKTRKRLIPNVPQRIAPEDLDSEGRIGLWLAALRFDPWRNVSFRSFAIGMIRGRMLEYLRQEDWAPRSVRAKKRAVERMEERLTMYLRRVPQPAEVAFYLNCTVDELDVPDYDLVSVDAPLGWDAEGHELTAADVLPASDDTAATVLQRIEAEEVACQLFTLPEQERTVLAWWYGSGMTQEEIAEALEMSESNVGRLRKKAVAGLGAFAG